MDHCFAANKVYEDSYKIVTVKNVLPILLEDLHRLLDPNNVNSFLLASFFAQYPDLVAFHPQWKPPSGQPANLTTLHARSSLTGTTDLTPANRNTTFPIHEHHNLSTPTSCAILCPCSATSTFMRLCSLLQPHRQSHPRLDVSPHILGTCVTQHYTNHYSQISRPIHPPSMHVQWLHNPSHHHTHPACMPSSSTTATITPTIYRTILPTQRQQNMTFPAPCAILRLRNATHTSHWLHLPPHQLLPLIIRHYFVIGSTLAAMCQQHCNNKR